MNSFEIAEIKSRHVWVVALTAVLVIVATAILSVPMARETLIAGDNDDILRWMSVKDLLAGQGWFDMTQYRVEAPEGLSLHWSRYLDAAIAGVYSLLALVQAPEGAERWTLVIWPNLLLVALLLVVGKGTARVLGLAAAVFAIVTVMTWFPIRGITFANGRVDHHNLQILLMSCVTMAMIWPEKALRSGVLAGLAAAFSLAIGLEMLVFVAVAGIILFLRAAFEVEGAAARLAGFCAALLGGGVLFFAGQTAPSHWLVPHCDALSTPFLAILLIAAVSCGLPLLLYRRIRHPALRIGISAGLTIGGVAIFAGLISPCLAGPYGILPAEVQEMITSRISEALPGHQFAMIRPLSFMAIVVPILAVVGFGSVIWLRDRQNWTVVQRAAIGQMLVFGWLGLLGSMIQIRMNIIAAPALPFLAGVVFTKIILAVQQQRSAGRVAALVAAVVSIFAVQQMNAPLLAVANWVSQKDVSQGIEAATSDKSCRDEATLAHLNVLPQARMLTQMGVGSDLLLTTHHSVLSVPYQRGAWTFWNGSFPFRSEDLMLRAIAQSKPDYVVLCAAARFDGVHVYARDLVEGKIPAWLEPVSVGSDDLLVLRVTP